MMFMIIQIIHDFEWKKSDRGFPHGSMVKNMPANAGNMGSIFWSGTIPHAAKQLSPCAATTEPVLSSPGFAPTEP